MTRQQEEAYTYREHQRFIAREAERGPLSVTEIISCAKGLERAGAEKKAEEVKAEEVMKTEKLLATPP